MREWVDVASLDELARHGRVVARIGGREVGVLVVADTLWAVRNRCPHHGAPLCLGMVREREAGAPGSYERSGRTVLRCPWHGWEFDLATGLCPDDPSMRVATYEVRVVEGRVQVLA